MILDDTVAIGVDGLHDILEQIFGILQSCDLVSWMWLVCRACINAR